METGTLAKWSVKAGDFIKAGDILADIETDKATMEFESIEDGKIIKLLVEEGTTNIPVNQAIAELALDDEDIVMKPEHDLKESNLTGQNDLKKTKKHKTSMHDAKVAGDRSQIKSNQGRIKISPLAKRIASNHKIDISNIQGSGPHGRVIKKDVLRELGVEEKITLTNQKINVQDDVSETKYKDFSPRIKDLYSDREYSISPLTGIRKIVSNRLSESKRTIPHFYLRRTIKMDKLLTVRSELNQSFQNSASKFSINDFIIKAVAKSLQDNPFCNVIWDTDQILQLKSSDISVAVAIEGGLITPIVRDAEKKSLQEISQEMKEKVKRAKAKQLQPEEYSGGSCSISNLGMMGVENFDAVINPPQASILAVGSTVQTPLISDKGEMYVGSSMSVTLSADHRVIDGAVGAGFLASIIEYLSNPLKLLV
jgi:pyruvate dehydrogenase E2 component (dihydrolipoamide acetyltransferase)